MKLNKEDVQSAKEKAAKRIKDLSAQESILRSQIRQLERKIDKKISSLFDNIEEFTAKSFMGLAAIDSKVVQTKRLKSLFLEEIYPKKFFFFKNSEFDNAKSRAIRLVREAISSGEDVLEEIKEYSQKQKQLSKVLSELESIKAINSLSQRNLNASERKRIEAQISAMPPKKHSSMESTTNTSDDDFYYMYYWMWRNNALYEPVQRQESSSPEPFTYTGGIDYSGNNQEVRSSDSSIRDCNISNGSHTSADSADALGSSRDFACNTNDSFGSYS